MKGFWPLFFKFALPAPAPPASALPPLSPSPALGSRTVPGLDPALTTLAADLLRSVHCPALADRVAVRWHPRLSSTAGLAQIRHATVLLNPHLRAFPAEIDRTLRHELAHLVAHDRAGRRRIAAHGPDWRLACADLGIPGEPRCHSLPLPRRAVARPYKYRCPVCAFTLERTRPINARRHRLACRDCCRQHARGRFDPRFEFTRVA